MTNISIIGSGPRGLSTALYATARGHTVSIIDPDPINSWTPPNIIPNIEMRSPASFDLVTFLDELQDYSLLKFMGKKPLYGASQKEVELCPIPVERAVFCEYIIWILSKVLSTSRLILESVNKIEGNRIYTDKQVIESDAIILAIGSCSNKPVPPWVSDVPYRSLSNILSNEPVGQKPIIVGSGQGAAELVYKLARKNRVKWVVNKTPKVDQYPLPSWGTSSYKSGLSSYYSKLDNWKQKLAYLEEIKSWQPSITPYIKSRLNNVIHRVEIINPTLISSITDVLEDGDFICLQTGISPDINLINTDVKTYSFLPKSPELREGFRSSNDHVYITGMLAIPFDGPRQASLISAGITSREIIHSIESIWT